MCRRIFTAWLLSVCLLSGKSGEAVAQTPVSESPLWALCAADPLAALLTPAGPSEGELQVEADAADIDREQVRLRGGVRLSRGALRLQAPELTLYRDRNRLSADELSLGSPQFALTSARGEYDIDRGSGLFSQAEYFLAGLHGRGSAAEVEVDYAGGRSRLREVSYSTCGRDGAFWRLQAEELRLDRASGRGEADGVTLSLLETPIAYLPYLSFPIDGKRHSGFLTPRLGYSSDGGLDLRLPYYWNIAPNQDLTLYPRLIARRGALLGAEYRYLGRAHRGSIEAEYLPHDRQRDEDRGALKIEHRSNFYPRLYSELLAQRVSDDGYIDDLSNGLGLLGPNFLESRFQLSYLAEDFRLLGRIQDFQTVDEELFGSDDEPYGRLPQLQFNSRRALGGPFSLGLDAELVRFDTDSHRVTGRRLDLNPGLGAGYRRPWGFVQSRLAYRYTAYRLDELDTDPRFDDPDPDRGAPVFSVDGGLFLERPLDWDALGSGLLTLEPRLFYLYVPHRDQQHIPLFDTAELDPNIAFLFYENRFTGADRLGDANQVSAALTSRLLPEAGGERLRLSLAQAFYLSRPRVGLDEDSEPGDDRSDLFAEAALTLTPEFSLGGALRWDDEDGHTERGALDLRYRAEDEGRLVNFSHRFARGELEQLDLAFVWPFDGRWRSLGRWNYSLREDNTVDAFAGLEYDDCCWALRLLARHHRDEPDDERADNSLFVELELKGLTGFGRRIDRLLEDNIFGYESLR